MDGGDEAHRVALKEKKKRKERKKRMGMGSATLQRDKASHSTKKEGKKRSRTMVGAVYRMVELRESIPSRVGKSRIQET